MPSGTPYTPKCPKCRRGMYGYEHRPIEKGVHPTGVLELTRTVSSKHQGHGKGGRGFHGHRGQLECRDCGHKWWSTHPRSKFLRSYWCAGCNGRDGEHGVEIEHD